MVRPSTRALIEGAHRHSANYRGYFANHLPMALVALDAMGATDARIAQFAGEYERQLEPIGEAELGRVRRFEESLARRGVDRVLAETSARFAAGVGAAAFHGAIRTAYAIESGLRSELAHALAYWDAAYESLACDAEPEGDESPFEVLQAIANDPAIAGKRPPGSGISARMRAAAKSPAFASHVARLAPDALELPTLAATLIRAYAATGDFTLLHGVTGCQAFRVLAPHFSDPGAALRHLWIAAAAAYVSCGSPPVEGWALEGSDALAWDEIHRKAAECDDEHDVKFAYSCWREWQASRDELYRRAASARVCHALAEAAGAC
jgi:hypothetical protein